MKRSPTSPPSSPAPEHGHTTPESRGIFNTQVTWLWPGRIPFGKLTILDGDPGLGKSTLMLDLAARLTAGRALPDDPAPPHEPARVLLLSAEDAAADTIRPRLEAAHAVIDRVYVLSHLPDAVGGGLPLLPRFTPFLGQLVDRFRPCFLVIDPLAAYLGPEINPHSDQGVRQALVQPARLAERTGIAIVLIRHLTKRASRNPLYRGGGSIGLIGAARSGLLVAPDPSDPTASRRILASTKSNLATLPPSLAYRLLSALNGVVTVVWEGRSELTAESLVDPAAGRPASVLDEARSVLRTILADGPLPATVVQRQAAELGLSQSTLRRAREALRVRPRKVGPSWVWACPEPAEGSLPDSPTPREDAQNS